MPPNLVLRAWEHAGIGEQGVGAAEAGVDGGEEAGHRFRVCAQEGGRNVAELFGAFVGDVRLMPPEHCASAEKALAAAGEAAKARAVADYIAGMTDRYAILEHERLFNPAERT